MKIINFTNSFHLVIIEELYLGAGYVICFIKGF